VGSRAAVRKIMKNALEIVKKRLLRFR